MELPALGEAKRFCGYCQRSGRLLHLAEPGSRNSDGHQQATPPRLHPHAPVQQSRRLFEGTNVRQWRVVATLRCGNRGRPHPSGHPLTGSARQCPAASTHSAGSSEQITVLTSSIDALTPWVLKRSFRRVTNRRQIWNTLIPPSHHPRSPRTHRQPMPKDAALPPVSGNPASRR